MQQERKTIRIKEPIKTSPKIWSFFKLSTPSISTSPVEFSIASREYKPFPYVFIRVQRVGKGKTNDEGKAAEGGWRWKKVERGCRVKGRKVYRLCPRKVARGSR